MMRPAAEESETWAFRPYLTQPSMMARMFEVRVRSAGVTETLPPRGAEKVAEEELAADLAEAERAAVEATDDDG